MEYLILQFLIVFVLFFIVVPVVYYLTEVKGMPKWLDYKPFNCRLCCTFWTLLFGYIMIGIIFSFYITLIAGVLLAFLNSYAMWLYQKEHTVFIDENHV